MPTDAAAPTWNPLAPRAFAEMRLRMARYQAGPLGRVAMARALSQGCYSLFPHVDSTRDVVGDAAAILCAEEHTRLNEARLYVVDAPTSRAAAAVATPPAERVTARRLPSPSGLMMFAEPIGSAPLGPTGSHVAIVAASWSLWTADPQGQALWLADTVDGRRILRPGTAGIWLTFYASSHAPGLPALVWENETVLFLGVEFPALGSPLGATGAWSQRIYTTWQMMSQTGADAWTETEVVPRGRSKGRRDRRAGITGDVDVHVVRYRPPGGRTAGDGSTGGERTSPDHRWEVPPYRSPNRCSAPSWHADDRCTHSERIIRGHVNGPKDKPVRELTGPVFTVGT